MTLEYITNEPDYLAFYLFELSVSARRMRTRRRVQLTGSALCLAVAAVGILKKDNVLASLSIIAIPFWYFYWPLYEKRFYQRNMTKVVRETFGKIFGKITSLQITDEFIADQTCGTETKAPLSAITAINEIPGYIFIKLETGVGIVIPVGNISDVAAVKTRLSDVALANNIKYTVAEHWVWR